MNAPSPGGWRRTSSARGRPPAGPAGSTPSGRRSSAGWPRIPTPPAQILLHLREAGYTGGITILKDYVHQVRPPRIPAFLTLAFAPGECAQVDWGQFGSIAVGNTRRRLSFFAMVLCHSRMLYVEFTVSETMEHFLACHATAFAFFGGVPAKLHGR